MPIDVRGPGDRFVTHADGHTTYHSFSFGAHYDPHNIGFGALEAYNDEWLPPGTGYADHPHQNIEIVTVVLTGALRHRDSTGAEHVVGPGQVQRLSAGRGIVHAETAHGPAPTRFLQSWIRPDDPDGDSSYAVAPVPSGTGLLRLATGDDDEAAVRIGTRGTALYVATLAPGESLRLPEASRLHLFAAVGEVAVGERLLQEGAAARLVDEGGRPVRIPVPEALTAPGTDAVPVPSTLLVWALP